MAASDPKADLQRYLQDGRDALVWKLEDLSEYDIRRPLVGTGTNLLGLVKHLAGVEMGSFGDTFRRPCPDQLPWDEADPPRSGYCRLMPSVTYRGGRPIGTR